MSTGDATIYGSMGGFYLRDPVVGIPPVRSSYVYWEVGGYGSVYSF